MVIDMNESRIRTLAQVRQFLAGTPQVSFLPCADDTERYAHINDVVRRFSYAALGKADRGVLRRYLRITSGYKRAQLQRLVARAINGERLHKHYEAPKQPFARRFLAQDIVLLATVDRDFGTLSGPTTVHVLKRAYDVYADARFARLHTVSVSHLYNLRATATYQRQRVVRTKTQASTNAIGTRRAPAPEGGAGFIRIDSVHQGDQDGIKGVYHINAVDCVTQWQVLGCCERLSEAFLLPVIRQMLESFPFKILGFHADNGSEYINHQVAKMLDKLHAEFTKSRPRHSNDNGLAETKNGAVVRKMFGYEHIPQRFATRINAFNVRYLIPFINLHRPCLFATERSDPKKPARIRKVYRHADVMTPLEKLVSLDPTKQNLRASVSLAQLQAQAHATTDIQAAAELNKAKQHLFAQIHKRA
jgi:transposase InsO family protein